MGCELGRVMYYSLVRNKYGRRDRAVCLVHAFSAPLFLFSKCGAEVFLITLITYIVTFPFSDVLASPSIILLVPETFFFQLSCVPLL